MKFEVNSKWHNCKSNKYKLIFSYKTKIKNEKNFKIKGKYKRFFYECNSCKHVFAKYNFKLLSIYSKKYLDLTYKNIEGLSYRFEEVVNLPYSKSDNKQRVRRINFYLKKRAKILDIGSGTGVFLHEMKNKGHDVIGADLDKRYSLFLRKKGIKILTGDLTKLKIKKKYNLITLNKVLEHLKNTNPILKVVKKLITKNGLIYIEVPDAHSKIKGKFTGEFCIDHLQLFSIKSLLNMMENSGFRNLKIKRIIEPSGKYTIFGFFKKK